MIHRAEVQSHENDTVGEKSCRKHEKARKTNTKHYSITTITAVFYFSEDLADFGRSIGLFPI